ncbi:MAG: FadR family transcriptional regulator [Anaerolineales bacterium]|nr:FadR family transcriptional regulator [Anaerolineales bacterium]
MANQKEITTNTLVTSVTDQLRQMIVEGDVKVGEYFPSQKELAAQFGVGLSTIREAFQNLAAMGLVRSRPGKGTWVSAASYVNLMDPVMVKTRLGELHARQVYEARSVIEVALTQFASERATEAQIEKIWAALKAMETAESDEAFVEADLDFHLSVAAAGQNQLLEQFYHLTRELLSEIVTEMVALPEVKEQSILLQRRIAQYIEDKNVEEARQAALDHMQYIKVLVDVYG